MDQTRAETDIDSIEWGTPSKGGARKIYYDARIPDSAIERIFNANLLSQFAEGIATPEEVKAKLVRGGI